MKVNGAAHHRLPQVEDLGQRPSAKSLPPSAKGHGPAYEINFSETANEVLSFHEGRPHSTAQHARKAIGEIPGLAALPFGKVVSAIAHGINPATLIAAPSADDGTGEASGEQTTDETSGEATTGGTVDESQTETGDGSTSETGAVDAEDGLDAATVTAELIDGVADPSAAESGLVELLEELQEDDGQA